MEQIKQILHVVRSFHNGNRDGEITDASRHGLENLKEWYKEYLKADVLLGSDPILVALDHDTINSDQIEQQISRRVKSLPDFENFCGECREKIDHWPAPDGERLIHRSDSIALEAAARKGCRFCSFIRRCFDHEDLTLLTRIEGRLRALGKCPKFEILMWPVHRERYAHIRLPRRQNVWELPRFSSIRLTYLPHAANEHARPIEIHTIAARWLRDCHQSHNACKSRADQDLPTRLLRVADEHIKLVCTADWSLKPRYATLSHCWGDKEFTKLLKRNIDAFLRQMPIISLPRTFQEAINFVRELGLEYIWLDSLCIVQDDDEDWRAEAGRMASVYGGSFVNIAATSAKGPHEDLFMKPEMPVEGFRAKITTRYHASVVVQIEACDSYYWAITRSHLATRAWAFQEKMLSSRTIHFGNRGVFWECASKVANEFLPDGLCDQTEGLLETFQSYSSPPALWPKIVQIYSAAKITFPRDKLPALSGVAMHIHKLTGNGYLAGIWNDAGIELQLCWHIISEDIEKSPARSPRPTYRAPSWSWASVDDPVAMFDWSDRAHVLTLYARVLDAWTVPSGDADQFGEVTGGCMRITCSVLLEVVSVDDNELYIDISGEEHRIRGSRDCSEPFKNSGQYQCFLLPLIGIDSEYLGGGHWTKGIVVRRTNLIKGEFQRVGSFSDLARNAESNPLVRAMDDQGQETARAQCAEIVENREHPEQCHVITLV